MITRAYRYWCLDHNTGELVAPIVAVSGALARYPDTYTTPSEHTKGLYASLDGNMVLKMMLGTPIAPEHLVFSSVLLENAMPWRYGTPGEVVTHTGMRISSVSFCDSTPQSIREKVTARYRRIKVAADWPADLWRAFAAKRDEVWADATTLQALDALKAK